MCVFHEFVHFKKPEDDDDNNPVLELQESLLFAILVLASDIKNEM